MIAEASEEGFEPEHGGELGADTFESHEHHGGILATSSGHRLGTDFLLRSQQRAALRLDFPDLAHEHLDPLDLANDSRLEIAWHGSAVRRPQRVEPLPPVPTQRIVVRDKVLNYRFGG